MQVLKGPVRTMAEVTKRTVAENNIIASAKLALITSSQQTGAGDCDGDGFIEPIPYTDAGAEPHPVGGGFLPSAVGAALNDPWDTRYGYCVWDHGTVTGSCSGANLLAGVGTNDQPVIAIISAGSDRIFQTSCVAGPAAELLVKPAGTDDVVLGYTYAEAEAGSGGLWNLKSGDPDTAQIAKNLEVKDSAGTTTFALDAATGIGDFLGVVTDALTAKTDVIEVTGGLKFDDSKILTGACTDADAFAYDTAADVLLRCDGTNWVQGGGADNLGNHIAEENIQVGSFWLSGDGGNEGIQVSAAGAVTTSSSLAVGASATVAGALGVTGNATVDGTLGATGATTLTTLSTTGTATLNAATITNAASVGGTFGATGATTLGNTLGVTGATTLGSTLAVTGAATLSDALGVAGTATVNALGVTNGATVSGTLGVTGATSLSTLSTSGTATLAAAAVTGNASVGGDLDMTSGKITNLATPTSGADATTKAYVDAQVAAGAGFVESDPQVGTLTNTKWCTTDGTAINCTSDTPAGSDNLGNHTATQALAMAAFKITGMADPTASQDAATKSYVDAAVVSGADDLGNHIATTTLSMGSNKITNLLNPTAAQDAATKAYVDSVSGGGGGGTGATCISNRQSLVWREPEEEWYCSELFTQTANLPQSKYGQSQSTLADGKVLICGGDPNPFTNRCDTYDPATGAFTQVANLPQSKVYQGQSTLSDGRVLFCGGHIGAAYTNRCDIYNPTTNAFTQVANLPQSKYGVSQSTLSDGRVLICGGHTGAVTNRCDIYNPTTNAFTQVANLPESKHVHSQSTLSDGRVLICGGLGAASTSTNRCDIYNPTTNAFTQVANLPQSKYGLSQSTLADGRVLICDGNSSSVDTNRCDIYNPTTDAFTQVTSLTESKRHLSQSTLSDGRVLICGGIGGSTRTTRCDTYAPEASAGGGVGGGGGSVTADSLDFTDFKDAMALDASTDIAIDGSEVFSVTNTGTGAGFVVNDESSDASPFIIDADGKVGVGDITPDHTLDVAGNIGLSASGYLNFGDTSGTSGYGIRDNAGTIECKNSSGSWAACAGGGGGGSDLEYFGGSTLLVGPINYSSTTPTNHYAVTVPAGTKALRLSVYYQHGGTTNHGYLSFLAYQKGQTNANKKVTYESYHYDAYYNTDYTELTIPWDDALVDEVTIQVTQSYNTSALNDYFIYHVGHIVGSAGGGGGSVTADSLDFTDFKDAMALDASTDIAVDGTEVFSVTNTGTGNSFVVNDTSSDTTPFVIDNAGNVGIGASGYLNFGSTLGTSGYGIRDNAGTIECKNSSGSWAACAGGGSDDLGDHTATQALAMATFKITGMGDPTSAQDATTKAYVDTAVAAAADNLGNHTATQLLRLFSATGGTASGASGETDPQVGTLTNTKWCTTDGTVINCTENAPSSSLPSLTDALIWVGNGSNVATAVALSGDATISNAGVLSLAADSVAASEIATNGVGAAEIAANAVGASEVTDASLVATTELSATGTKNSTTFLRGDNTWASASVAGTLCGLAHCYQDKNGSGCASYTSYATCNGSSIVSSCPSGYTQINITATDYGNAGTAYNKFRACSKN